MATLSKALACNMKLSNFYLNPVKSICNDRPSSISFIYGYFLKWLIIELKFIGLPLSHKTNKHCMGNIIRILGNICNYNPFSFQIPPLLFIPSSKPNCHVSFCVVNETFVNELVFAHSWFLQTLAFCKKQLLGI